MFAPRACIIRVVGAGFDGVQVDSGLEGEYFRGNGFELRANVLIRHGFTRIMSILVMVGIPQRNKS